MKRDPKIRKQERQALERAILRALRSYYINTGSVPPGRLTDELQATLYGLEKARRNV